MAELLPSVRPRIPPRHCGLNIAVAVLCRGHCRLDPFSLARIFPNRVSADNGLALYPRDPAAVRTEVETQRAAKPVLIGISKYPEQILLEVRLRETALFIQLEHFKDTTMQ